METFGLNKVVVDNLYRAEVLQEKRELDPALKYFQRVLHDYPNCNKARQDAKLTAEIILQHKRENMLVKRAKVPPAKRMPYQIIETDISWSGTYYHPQLGGDPLYDEDAMAREAAMQDFDLLGYGNSLLTLVKNVITSQEGFAMEGLYMTGMATFKASLIPGSKTKQSVESTKLSVESKTMAMLKRLIAELNDDSTSIGPSAKGDSLRYSTANLAAAQQQERKAQCRLLLV